MSGFWSLFSGIADWKRKLIFLAFLVGLGGMLWETNDLIQENPDHPIIAPEASLERQLQAMQLDEYGDPVAIARPPKSLPYAKLWSSPVTQLALTFALALVIGSLIRSLLGGSFALVLVVLLVVLLVGQGGVIDFFKNQETGGILAGFLDWATAQTGMAQNFLLNSLPAAMAAVAGGWIGLAK